MASSDNDTSFSICETISETCESLLTQSFAIHRVDEDTANAISTAWSQAKCFFALSEEEKSARHDVINGNLHGFHTPSEAKMLFRAFCGSSQQPWPNDAFQTASEQVAEKLHSLLLQCHAELIKKYIPRNKGNDDANVVPSSKRRKQTSPLDVPLSANKTDSTCPLDYFFYHGDKPHVVSCSEHVDRGILICVCLTFVPGLEVLPRGEDAFVCPEIQTRNASLYSEKRACPGLVCIMAGDQLKQILPETKACIHRVRNDLKQSRMSISYELRAS